MFRDVAKRFPRAQPPDELGVGRAQAVGQPFKVQRVGDFVCVHAKVFVHNCTEPVLGSAPGCGFARGVKVYPLGGTHEICD